MPDEATCREIDKIVWRTLRDAEEAVGQVYTLTRPTRLFKTIGAGFIPSDGSGSRQKVQGPKARREKKLEPPRRRVRRGKESVRIRSSSGFCVPCSEFAVQESVKSV
jgi:hypothetical protein